MKIEGNRPNPLVSAKETAQAQEAEQIRGTRSDGRSARGTRSADRVEVSPDARLLDTAVKAVAQAPDVRQDVVERARQKLAAGEVGKDVQKLADRIIDSLLSR